MGFTTFIAHVEILFVDGHIIFAQITIGILTRTPPLGIRAT